MIRIFVNALAASAGGGLTYICNVVPQLANRDDVHTTVLLSSALRNVFPESSRVKFLRADCEANSPRRLWYEQVGLPFLIRRSRADVLLSPGNFAMFGSPVPQILLSRNALYTSRDFVRDLRERGEYRMWLDNAFKSALAKWSVNAADCTVAPSAAFAHDLHQWTGNEIVAIHHGFDPEIFFRDQSPLPVDIQVKLQAAQNSLRLLFVSHYNYYRNFETLFRAVANLKNKLHPRTVRLMLTCSLNSQENPGSYRAEPAAALVRELGIRDEIVELGSVPYGSLHHLYRACDFYVTAAYAETFAHPLVEAMASGLPVLASDLPVHREICGEAAVYFFRFSPEVLASHLLALTQSPNRSGTMREMGLLRARDFSWQRHVDQLLLLSRQLARPTSTR
jgi:glycosyltransferase involved in cell wall biosynthesis